MNLNLRGAGMSSRKTTVIDSLTGSFLVSTQKMPDPRFEEQVIFICAHSDQGAMGLAINQRNDLFSLADVLKGANMMIPTFELPPVHIGGPVELESAFILYSSDYHTEHQMDITSTISLSRQTVVLEDIMNGIGPEKYLFLLGYTGWGPGQLENELVEDGWLMVPGNDHIIFDIANEDKWRTAAMQYGIDICTFGDEIGFA